MKTWPDWPAAMKRATAAAYCDMSVASFNKEVAIGRLPSPILLGGLHHWTRTSIDQQINNLEKNLENGDLDWRSKVPMYAEKRRSGGSATTEQAKAHLLELSGGKPGPKLSKR
jgi:predicted DNA-binding transcriptional regulator AlpA